MAWDKIRIQRDNGEYVDAQAPIIVSASRSTDIPAFYADWFFARLEKGYSAWTNPFNGVANYVSYAKTRFIVFWSKNPKPLLKYLPILREKSINCYIQFTMNDYDEEKLEKGVPPLNERIETFKKLVSELGFGRVIWRFDPLILTDKISVNDLLKKIENIGNQLQGYTEKLVFSFADISAYKKVKSNLTLNGIDYKEFDESQMVQLVEGLVELNKKWGYTLATCGEKIDLDKYGVQHNKCIDDELMAKYFHTDEVLMDFLGIEVSAPDLFDPNPHIVFKKNNKDKGQRALCGCINSKDIGQYNTCPHLCEYCYANASKETALNNWKRHKDNPFNESIIG